MGDLMPIKMLIAIFIIAVYAINTPAIAIFISILDDLGGFIVKRA
jgi:hypothetical protein